MGRTATTSSAAETTGVSSRPRHRRRDGYFWQLIVLRIPVAVFAVAVIAYLVHYIDRWQGAVRRPEDASDPSATRKDARGQSGLALGMASVSLAVAVWEIISRLAPRRRPGPRPLGPWTIFFDLLVIGLGVPGWLFFAMAEYDTDPSYPTPWRDDQERAAMMVIVFWILHCVMCIMGCSACCGCCGCGPAGPAKEAAVTTAPVYAVERQDLEEAGAPEPLPNYKQSTGLEEIEAEAHPADPPSYPEAVRLAPRAGK